MSLVSLFHMIHPHSESAQEAARQQAAGTDLLKVRTATVTRVPAEARDKCLLCGSEMLHGGKKNPILRVFESAGLC